MRSARKSKRDKGATLVEASLAFPILILIVVSILELGMLFKDYLTVSYLSREAARIGALAGDDPEADCAILLGIEALASPRDLDRMGRVEIYRASPQGLVLAGPNTGVYVGGGQPQCTPGGDPDDTWVVNSTVWPPVPCTPSTEPNCRAVSVGPNLTPDIIGVRLQMPHDWITGFPPYRGTVQIDERTITRMEPKAFFPAP
jgi:Flp pilus assembly protein TadG